MRPSRILLGFMLVLAVLALGVYALRLPIAGWALRAAMASVGLEAPRARVTALSLSRLRIEDVAAGGDGRDGFLVETLEADYRLSRLWTRRTVDAVRLGPASVRVSVDAEGAISLAGLEMKPGGPRSGAERAPGRSAFGPLPFDALAARGIELVAQTPQGRARALIDADYDVRRGGRATLAATTQAMAYKAFRVENAALELDLVLAGDGAARINAALAGDAFSPDGAVRNADVALRGEGRPWSALAQGRIDAFAFGGVLEIDTLAVPVETVPALAEAAVSPAYAAARGAPVRVLTVSGDAAVDLRNGALAVGAGPRPLALRADTGLALTATALDGAPFYARGDGAEALSLAYAVRGGPVDASGGLSARTLGEGWRVAASAEVGAFDGDRLSLQPANLALDGVVAADRVEADIALATAVNRAALGDYVLEDAPIDVAASVLVDPQAEEAAASLAGGCLAVPRLTVAGGAPAMQMRLSGAALCPREKTLARVGWGDGVALEAAGEFKAETLRYRMGETALAGAPPVISFDAAFSAADGMSVSGELRGGRMILNDMAVAERPEGDFSLSLGAGDPQADLRLDRVRLAQKATLEMAAPVIAAGDLSLREGRARFAYRLATPAGAALGKGGGVHHLETGRGETTFRSGRLAFTPGGLQPERLFPVLRGVVDNAAGAIAAEAKVAWAPDALSSGAVISFEDVSFAGPTRVVTRTRGVNGALAFDSLAPVATAGEQTITVDGVDLDALVLENGEIAFDMPGDETVRIARAFFPWFGGTLGVYDASASMASGEAFADLRVDRIDLDRVLTYFDMDGLDGEGILSGVLPLAVRDGRAFIEDGRLESQGPGAVRYESAATDQAAAAGGEAEIAFDILRDLQYDSLSIGINGPLDGRLAFEMRFKGSGEVSANSQTVRVPVNYNITLDAALLELVNQANLSRDLEMQIRRGLAEQQDGEGAARSDGGG